jgi:hypothetical protein
MSAEMKQPKARDRRIPAWSLWAVGLALLAAHCVYFTVHTDRAARSFDATLVPPNSIPGMAEPRFFLDNDAYAWMAHTRDLMASGGWRIRHTFMDNAPYGREMHWSHLLIWTMRGMATAIMAETGWPAARAVELAGVWVMPIFQFLCLGLFFVVLAKKLGWAPAGLFCALFLTLNGFVWGFHPLRPDHHGLQLCFVLGSFLSLQFGGMGWTRKTGENEDAAIRAFRAMSLPGALEARRWFAAAGILGGSALWLGATIWMFALPVIGAAAGMAMPMLRRIAPEDESYRADLWRLWARTGCAAGALFYLLEYAPHHFSMRLEVNHPWHWVFWLGIAECLRTAGKMGPGFEWKKWRRSDWVPGAAGLLAALSLPLAITLGPPEWHQMREAVLQRLHARFIEEFRNIFAATGGAPLQFFFLRMGILPLVFPWIGWLLWDARRTSPRLRRDLLPGLVFSGLFLGLFLWQQRWGFFLTGGMAWLFILALGDELSPARPVVGKQRAIGGTLVVALLFNCALADGMRLHSENLTARADSVIPAWVQSSLMKRMALQWGLAAGKEEWRMAGMAIEAPMLYYFAGIRTVASYYWENAEGWKAESAFFADGPEGRTAFDIAKQRGLTHVCISLTPELPKLYWFVATGRYSEQEGMQRSLAGQLAVKGGGQLPKWIEWNAELSEIGEKGYVFQTPRGYATEKTWAQVFELKPDQKP